jgi:hypothetical protein
LVPEHFTCDVLVLTDHFGGRLGRANAGDCVRHEAMEGAMRPNGGQNLPEFTSSEINFAAR